jgi:hypothetical protein
MNTHRIPGAAVAVVRDGDLVHLAGYGQADGPAGPRPGHTFLDRIGQQNRSPPWRVPIHPPRDRGLSNASAFVPPVAPARTTSAWNWPLCCWGPNPNLPSTGAHDDRRTTASWAGALAILAAAGLDPHAARSGRATKQRGWGPKTPHDESTSESGGSSASGHDPT